MQALKYLTTPNITTTIQRPAYGTHNEQVYDAVSNYLSEQAAIFLTECGVEDVVWETKEGQTWPYLYIWGRRTFIYYGSSNHYTYIGLPDVGKQILIGQSGSNNTLISYNTPFVFSFTGNPKKAWVLRIMKQPWPGTQSANGLLMAKFENSLSGDQMVAYGGITSSKSGTEQYFQYSDGTAAVVNPAFSFAYDAFHKHGLGDSVPLAERFFEWFRYKNVYLWPSGLVIEGNDNYILYQREIIIGAHRYIVLKKMGVGLIRLEDDDPGITENELLGGGG